MSRKAKLEKEADRLIRDLVIFPRDGYICQRCGTPKDGYKEIGKGKKKHLHKIVLQPHHIIGRTNRRLRWDKINILTICDCCHEFQKWHPGDFDTWYSFKFPDRWAYINAHKPELFRVNVKVLEDIIEDLKNHKELFT